jgi:hypothetical protein
MPQYHLFFRPFDQHIPSQCCNVFFWRVQSIAMWPPLIFWPAHSLAHGPLNYSGWRIQLPIAPLNIPAGAFYCQSPPLIFCLVHSLVHGPFYYSGWRIQSPITLLNIPATHSIANRPFNILAGAFSRPWPPLLLQLLHSIASSSCKGATGRVLSKSQNLCRSLRSDLPWWSSFFAVFFYSFLVHLPTIAHCTLVL